MGSKKRPFYRFVAADTRYQRDGRFIEICGYYDPMEKPFKIHVDRDKVIDWLKKGAQMSETVESLLRTEGIVQDFNRTKAEAKSKSSSSSVGAKNEAASSAVSE